jgi:hypothetical protein
MTFMAISFKVELGSREQNFLFVGAILATLERWHHENPTKRDLLGVNLFLAE